MDAFISLDLDFLNSPTYIGNMYGDTDYKSLAAYKTTIKRWLTIEEIKSKIEKKRAAFSRDNTASIFNLKGKVKEKVVYINIDQHHNMYWHNKNNDIHSLSTSSFKPYECNINLFQENLIEKFIWVIPDYYGEQELKSHLSFNQEISKDENKLYFHFIKNVDIEFEFIKWSDFNFSQYNIKFLSVVTNPQFSFVQPEELDEIKEIMSIW